MTAHTKTAEAEYAEARIAAYGLLSCALRYPDHETVLLLNDPARWQRWPDILERPGGDLAARLAAVRSWALEHLASGDGEALADLRDSHSRIFGHAVRGTCPPYELEYGRGEIIQQASELADIAGFYSAFGVEMAADGNERADHVAAQCEFLCVLSSREVHARGEGNVEALDVIGDAQRSFLEDHLGRWLPALAHRVFETDPDGFHAAVLAFARSLVETECERLGVACGSEHLDLRPVSVAEDTSISCGTGQGAPDGPADRLVQLNIDSPAGSGGDS